MSIPKPPATHFNGYYLRDRHVTYDTKKGEIELMTGWVWIAEPVSCPVTGNMSYLLEVQPIGRERSTLLVKPEDMNAKYLKKALGQRGIIVHHESKLPHYLSMTASYSDYTEKVPRILIESPGWFANGQGFYTGRKVIRAQGVDESRYRLEPISRAPVAVKGSVEDWKENIGVHAQNNPVILTSSCIFIASPFLRMMGLGTRLVNIHGSKGTGKTLCSQIGASIWGNGTDPAAGLYSEDAPYVTKFSTTMNGIEPLLARYSPLPIALDEMTEQTAETVGELLYKIASGEGKHRMTSQMEAAAVNRWLLTIIATSEKGVADAVKAGGKALLGGQQDRAIDIPIDRIGVISNFGDFNGFPELTRHLKKACGDYYGAPGEAILQFACDNPELVRDVISMAPEIEERLMPPNCGDGERRIVKFLAAAVVAGNLAILAGVLDCEPEVVENAVKLIVMEWWHGRGGSLRRIAEFLSANYADVKEHAPVRRSSAKAFIDGNLIIIPDHVFDNEFGDEAKGIIAELVGLNALIREQDKRNKSRFCNNSLYAYVIKLDRVEPILMELEDRENDSDGEVSGQI
ncbi:DUF927 domain-containing protein [Duganella sp. FT3S]|uniref:DUF927 domain-containing protein n=1 Tax=Rugamonas fusca TaxID=2758568 RepID=A0A7W2EI50_9BURK|nr:DUF927 domain-containing protein [Rugamonas fusca]MBA5606269.1 DUF927 domain-containing protein [Rugamonas fusca]